MEFYVSCRDVAMVITCGLILILQLHEISAAALQVQSPEVTWDNADAGCKFQRYVLLPGRKYRAKGIANVIADGQTVWLNGWRVLTDTRTDVKGRVKTLKVDLSRSFKSSAKSLPSFICKSGGVFDYPDMEVTSSLDAESACAAQGNRLATVDSEEDYKDILGSIVPDKPHWLDSVTTAGTFMKQCLAAKKIGGDVEYFYTKCNQKYKFICLKDESLIVTFSTLVSQKLIRFEEVEEIVNEGNTLFDSSTEIVTSTSPIMPSPSLQLTPSPTETFAPELTPSPTETFAPELTPSPTETFAPSSTPLVFVDTPKVSSPALMPSSESPVSSSVTVSETSGTDIESSEIIDTSFLSLYIPDLDSSDMDTTTFMQTETTEMLIPSATSSILSQMKPTSSVVEYSSSLIDGFSSASYSSSVAEESNTVTPGIMTESTPTATTMIPKDMSPVTTSPGDMYPDLTAFPATKLDVISSTPLHTSQAASDAMDKMSSVEYTGVMTDHIRYTVSSVLQSSEAGVIVESPTSKTIPTSEYKPTYRILPTPVVDDGKETKTVYTEKPGDVDEEFSEEIDIDEESDENDINETGGQSRAVPPEEEEEGWDVGIWVAFIILIVLVCVSLLIAFFLYRKRKRSRSKTLSSNGAAATSGGEEMQDHAPPAKTPPKETAPRDSTTFTDKNYDL